ncbi:hypothetical protein YC2023_063790 [Brassica napus]
MRRRLNTKKNAKLHPFVFKPRPLLSLNHRYFKKDRQDFYLRALKLDAKKQINVLNCTKMEHIEKTRTFHRS